MQVILVASPCGILSQSKTVVDFIYPHNHSIPRARLVVMELGVVNLEGEDYMLVVPWKIIEKIHEDIRGDPDRLRGHLVRAIKIGLLAIEGGEFTLSTDRIEDVINNSSSLMIDK